MRGSAARPAGSLGSAGAALRLPGGQISAAESSPVNSNITGGILQTSAGSVVHERVHCLGERELNGRLNAFILASVVVQDKARLHRAAEMRRMIV